ncbi:MAG: PQQ-binding-like beta-propeller repeat protein [Planctomycetota bacterium]|nr:PQQ-binding-like beta-propeller repeat protein [Planctomycetota bacterium]
MPNEIARGMFVLLILSTPVFGQRLENGDALRKSYGLTKPNVGALDWPQLGGTPLRNSTPRGRKIPVTWNTETGKNIAWSVPLGSQTHGTIVVANGRIFISSNNGGGYLARYPKDVDLGCLLCFDESDGTFLWQYSAEKLKTGRVQDWPLQGMVSAPLVDGDRLWLVSNRGEVVCLDTLGFADKENDGDVQDEDATTVDEADVVWKFDMMKRLGVSQHNMCTCSCTSVGDMLFVVTGNGVDESHVSIPSPDAPDFIVLNRKTGKLLWKFEAPGIGSFHGSWSSPSYAVLGGRPQVLFPAGDGWLYSFDPAGDGNGGPKLLWEFDCNLKSDRWILGGRGRRDEYITPPVIHNGRVYVTTGQDCEHGEGEGILWCIDPGKFTDGSDVSLELLKGRTGHVLSRREARDGFPPDFILPNPKSAVVWKYVGDDANKDGKLGYEERVNRTLAPPTLYNGLLFLSDFSGFLHCFDAETGRTHWRHDMFAASWIASPLVVDGKVYVCDEDGDVEIFKASKEKTFIGEVNMPASIYSSAVVANEMLYICTKNRLYAIRQD